MRYGKRRNEQVDGGSGRRFEGLWWRSWGVAVRVGGLVMRVCRVARGGWMGGVQD
jgi:hypothetical protein